MHDDIENRSIRTSYLVYTFLEVTAISGITCCYGHLVTMGTEACTYNIAVKGIRTSYLVHTFLEATAISGITCCYRYLVTMATEAGAYNIVVGRYRNLILGT